MEEVPKPEPIAIWALRGRFGTLVDEVAEGHPASICRRSSPLAPLLPAAQHEELSDDGL